MPRVVTEQHLVGAQELIAAIAEVGTKVASSAARRGIYAAVAVIRNEVRKRAPERTGALKKSVTAFTMRRRNAFTKKTEIVGGVGISPKAFTVTDTGRAKLSRKKKGDRRYKKGEIYPRNYAHLVEFGTRPHAVGKGSKLVVYNRKARTKHAGLQHGQEHPGSRAQPFFRPSFDAKKGEAADAFKAKVLESMAKGAAAAAAKARTKKS